jgi:hypothetical protein
MYTVLHNKYYEIDKIKHECCKSFQTKNEYYNIYCINCDKIYTNIQYKWCKSCQIKNLINWTSGNEKIDNFIQTIRLKINEPKDMVFEWIPYNQLDKIKKQNKCNFATISSAIWKNGPLYWNKNIKRYMRKSNKNVSLKYLYNLQNLIDFLNEV